MAPEELVDIHNVLHDGGWCQVLSQQVEDMREAAIGNQVLVLLLQLSAHLVHVHRIVCDKRPYLTPIGSLSTRLRVLEHSLTGRCSLVGGPCVLGIHKVAFPVTDYWCGDDWVVLDWAPSILLHGDGLVVEKLLHDDLVLVMALVEKFVAHCLSGRWLITWMKTGHQGLEEGMFNDAEWQASPIQGLEEGMFNDAEWQATFIQELSNQVIQVIFGSCWSCTTWLLRSAWCFLAGGGLGPNWRAAGRLACWAGVGWETGTGAGSHTAFCWGSLAVAH